jgi:hypothetical protein
VILRGARLSERGADANRHWRPLAERRSLDGIAVFDRTQPGRVRYEVMDYSHGPVFVHFPHPGREHNPGGKSWQPWNTTTKHRRKFLCSPGRYVTADGSLVEASLAFWGEWEAPSYVLERWPEEGELPRFLQEPVWEYPTFSGPRQNTDPWVFGDCFRYSNCKQAAQKSLQTLPSGSVILFGSTLGLPSENGPRFVLDTVFVVGEQPQRFTPSNPPNTDEAFRVCTIESLTMGGDVNTCGGNGFCADTNASFALYSCATYEAPVNEMYSFVPCRRTDRENVRFARPALSLPVEFVNPYSWQSPKGAGTPLSPRKIQELWATVRKQVLAAECLIGVHFRTPREHKEVLPEHW